MLNLTTNSKVNSRDIIWLNKTYREGKNNKATISNVEDDNGKAQLKRVKTNGEKGSWEIIDEKDIPINCLCIKNKWISKVKRNGIFRARLMACGYSQAPGIDFSESFQAVLNDVSFRIILIAKIVWNMTCSVVDLETAFLHGDLDEEIYMEVPKGLEIEHNKKLMLIKTIYGLVQSARKFMRNLSMF
jgi:hypothetical protein